MRVKGSFLLVFCVCAVVGVVSTAYAQDRGEKVIRINGGGTASDLVSKWAKEFMRSRSGITVSVTGTSAGKGFQALVEGATDVAIMTRDATAEEQKTALEKGIILGSKTVRYVALAVVTHPRNPLNELSLDQIAKMFTGEHESWQEVGGLDERIRPVSRRVPESGAATFLQTEVLNGKAFAPNTVFVDTWRSVVKLCADGKDLSIGILPISLAVADREIKVLAVKKDQASPGVAPTTANISKKLYPVALPFSLMWDMKKARPELSEFLDFCSRKGLQGG